MLKQHKIIKNCVICNQEMKIYPSEYPDISCCSKKCTSIRQKNRRHSQKTIEKMRAINMGTKNPNWRGGIQHCRGYVLIKQPQHPFCNKKGYIMRFRLVMEGHLRRYLKPEERVHHINRIRNDDRIENLMLLANESEHQKIHHPIKKLNNYNSRQRP